jgi:hypothetical protein
MHLFASALAKFGGARQMKLQMGGQGWRAATAFGGFPWAAKVAMKGAGRAF